MSYPQFANLHNPSQSTTNSSARNTLASIQVKLNTPPVFSREQPIESLVHVNEAAERVPKVKLGQTPQDARVFENLATLFSILTALEHIETAFMADIVSYSDYYSHCSQLLQKYRMWSNAHKNLLGDGGVAAFAATYDLHCPAALTRIKEGNPMELDTSAPDLKRDQALLVSLTELFITTMDTLNLKLYAVDTIAPQLAQLSRNLALLCKPATPGTQPSAWAGGHVSVSKVDEWRARVQSMGASEELEEGDVRQLLFDLQSAYQWFKERM